MSDDDKAEAVLFDRMDRWEAGLGINLAGVQDCRLLRRQLEKSRTECAELAEFVVNVAVERDLAFTRCEILINENVEWQDLATAVQNAIGPIPTRVAGGMELPPVERFVFAIGRLRRVCVELSRRVNDLLVERDAARDERDKLKATVKLLLREGGEFWRYSKLEVDWLDDGWVHIFEMAAGERAPLSSVGCVRLVGFSE